MDTRKATSWAQVARERGESGMSVREFCRNKGIPENTYYYWQRKLRGWAVQQLGEAKQLTVTSGWVAVTESAKTSADAAQGLTVEVGSFKVRVVSDTDSELLAKTLKVLAELC